MIFCTSEKENKKKYAKKRASNMEEYCDLEGFHIVVHLRGCVGRIYPAGDVLTFLATITL